MDTVFQSTLPRGERLSTTRAITIRAQFQSTLPRGERRRAPAPERITKSFNPRSHVGSDDRREVQSSLSIGFNPRSHVGSDRQIMGRGLRRRMVSIHAPTWGATASTTPSLVCISFQSTLPRGERHTAVANNKLGFNVSIHAPTWGATRPQRCQRRFRVVSIHAPTWGATPTTRRADSIA